MFKILRFVMNKRDFSRCLILTTIEKHHRNDYSVEKELAPVDSKTAER